MQTTRNNIMASTVMATTAILISFLIRRYHRRRHQLRAAGLLLDRLRIVRRPWPRLVKFFAISGPLLHRSSPSSATPGTPSATTPVSASSSPCPPPPPRRPLASSGPWVYLRAFYKCVVHSIHLDLWSGASSVVMMCWWSYVGRDERTLWGFLLELTWCNFFLNNLI